MTRAILLVPLLALGLSVPAWASRTYTKLPPALDPTKAYVVVEVGKVDDGLIEGTLSFGRYDAEKADIAAPTPPPGGKSPRGGWPLDNRVFLQKSLAKTKDHRLFLAELDPGLWVLESANDTAFSLGSATLNLAPGTVTDIGVATIYSDFPEGAKRDVLTAGRAMKGALLGGLFVRTVPPPMPKAVDFRPRTVGDMPLPAMLGGARPAEWAGEVRFGNGLGRLVNRMGGRKARIRAQIEAAKVQETKETSPAEPAATPAS